VTNLSTRYSGVRSAWIGHRNSKLGLFERIPKHDVESYSNEIEAVLVS
jgi:hypothetical protein